MENKELTAAANALVGWFNSQELSPRDAETVMLKVLAKLFTRQMGVAEDSNAATARIIDLESRLTTEINLRLLHGRR